MAGFNSVEFNSSLGNHLNNQFPTAQVTDTNNEKKEYKPKQENSSELVLDASSSSYFNTIRRPRKIAGGGVLQYPCLLYISPSPRDS